MTSTPPRRPDASMTLITEVMERPLDPAYAEAARRRQENGPRSGGSAILLVLVALVLGLMTVTAAAQLRAPADGPTARELLEAEINDRRAAGDQQRERARELTAQIEELQQGMLAAQDGDLFDALIAQGVATGTVSVTGPGLVVTLSDAGGGLADGESSNRVQSVDLQTVVNALWASGAEAVSIDDQRLSPLSAIRHAGDAILIDTVGLTGPTYTVRAIGDAETMQTTYARTGVTTYLELLSSRWGIASTLSVDEDLELPGVGAQRLRYATLPDDDAMTEESREENP